MEDEQPAPPPAAATAYGKLPECWRDAPALWFLRAECNFLSRNVAEEQERFCLVVKSLPRDAMQLVKAPQQSSLTTP